MPGWTRQVTRYQWLVFSVVASAWSFDSLDQRIFSLARIPALASLMAGSAGSPSVQAFGKIATAIFLLGWGIGGLTFGALGDRLGRTRMLAVSIICYSVCTGLTALSRSAEMFAVLRFFTGIGIGGVFGLAVATLAETVSGSARVAMLAWLQILSLLCNVAAGFIKMGLDALAARGWLDPAETWRALFAIGALPAGIGLVALIYLKESDAWLKLKLEGELPASILGAYRKLLADRTERRGLIVGTLLSVAGVVGLWSIGEYAVDLQDIVFTTHFARDHDVAETRALVSSAKNWAFILQMLGGAAGMLAFTWVADRIGRRPAFIIGFGAAFVVTINVYATMATPADAYWMMPVMGAAQLGIFAGFAIYLPELFGTAVRGTGISFAYNAGRFAAAAGSFGSALLTTRVFGDFAPPLPLRYSAIAMCSIFLVGAVTSFFAPETRGRDLRA